MLTKAETQAVARVRNVGLSLLLRTLPTGRVSARSSLGKHFLQAVEQVFAGGFVDFADLFYEAIFVDRPDLVEDNSAD